MEIEIKDHKDIALNVEKPEENAQLGNSYLLSDDLLRSLHPEIKEAKTYKAIYREFQNGTKHVIIHYQTQNNTHYKGIMKVDLATFIFK